MGNREVLEADSRGDLVVNDAVSTCREQAQKNNVKFPHRQRITAPNENTMSCRERERASRRIDGLKSCEAG
jgi:hypothetical protein